jgi:hypothetical protein
VCSSDLGTIHMFAFCFELPRMRYSGMLIDCGKNGGGCKKSNFRYHCLNCYKELNDESPGLLQLRRSKEENITVSELLKYINDHAVNIVVLSDVAKAIKTDKYYYEYFIKELCGAKKIIDQSLKFASSKGLELKDRSIDGIIECLKAEHATC